MEIKLNFTSPAQISPLVEYDSLIIDVLNKSMFVAEREIVDLSTQRLSIPIKR
jgi:hypothetical protein